MVHKTIDKVIFNLQKYAVIIEGNINNIYNKFLCISEFNNKNWRVLENYKQWSSDDKAYFIRTEILELRRLKNEVMLTINKYSTDKHSYYLEKYYRIFYKKRINILLKIYRYYQAIKKVSKLYI